MPVSFWTDAAANQLRRRADDVQPRRPSFGWRWAALSTEPFEQSNKTHDVLLSMTTLDRQVASGEHTVRYGSRYWSATGARSPERDYWQGQQRQ
jgi:hypothetical protein